MMRPIISLSLSLSLSLILTASACAATDRSALDRARAEPEVPSIPVAAASAPQWSEGEARAMLREIDPLGGT